MEDWESVKARLEKEGAGNQTIAADIRAALERAEELEREKAELLPGVDAPHRRIKGLERERDEWRDTARSEMAGRAAAEAAIASLEDNADVWEKRALKAEAEFASLLRTYNAAAQAWGRDEAALTAERARLTALLDVSDRKLGEWRDRGAEMERLRAALQIIAGEKQCLDNLMSNVDVARAALATEVEANVVTEGSTTYVRSLSAPAQPEEGKPPVMQPCGDCGHALSIHDTGWDAAGCMVELCACRHYCEPKHKEVK